MTIKPLPTAVDQKKLTGEENGLGRSGMFPDGFGNANAKPAHDPAQLPHIPIQRPARILPIQDQLGKRLPIPGYRSNGGLCHVLQKGFHDFHNNSRTFKYSSLTCSMDGSEILD